MEKSQESEKYSLNQIEQLFDYDTMIQDNPCCKQDVDSVMSILHTALNTSKPTIRISGQDIPAMPVIAKLMKLEKESIMYAIKKYQEQTERIKNPAAYMLTILYTAPEQCLLDMKNQKSHERAQADQGDQTNKLKKESDTNKRVLNSFMNFEQRTYDYDELERKLLSRWD